MAFSHDWLTGMRGGERVLELLCDGFPQAPIFTLIHRRGGVSERIESHSITTSALQHVPGIFRAYRYFLPFYPLAVRALCVPPVDLVISTSHCVAKAVRIPHGARHLCYCFTPMRYAWGFYDEYFGTNRVKAAAIKPMLAALRWWDRKTSKRVDRFVTLSQHVRQRIRTFYGQDAAVVYPPVNTDFFTPGDGTKGDYDLIVAALVPYKRVDLAIAAYRRLGFPLVVVGTGTEFRRLRAMAAPNIRFLGWQSDEQVRELYRHCRFLIFPGEEDFGLVPVEAQACGRPVIAFARGGAAESVRDGRTGILFPEQSVDSLSVAVKRAMEISWDPREIRQHALQFSAQNFIDALDTEIQILLGNFPNNKC